MQLLAWDLGSHDCHSIFAQRFSLRSRLSTHTLHDTMPPPGTLQKQSANGFCIFFWAATVRPFVACLCQTRGADGAFSSHNMSSQHVFTGLLSKHRLPRFLSVQSMPDNNLYSSLPSLQRPRFHVLSLPPVHAWHLQPPLGAFPGPYAAQLAAPDSSRSCSSSWLYAPLGCNISRPEARCPGPSEISGSYPLQLTTLRRCLTMHMFKFRISAGAGMRA